MRSLSAILVLLVATIFKTDAFAQYGHPSIQQQTLSKTALSMAETSADVKKTTLTDETKWRLRLLLNDVTTTKGKKLEGQLFVLEGNFIEEEG